MQLHQEAFPPTIVIRHRLENLKKCSLRGLEERADFLFLTYPTDPYPSPEGTIILSLDGAPLTKEDSSKRLLLVDATWRYAAKMMKPLEGLPPSHYRSLPAHFRTAYPRRQDDCPDPSRGLASIEALYLSYLILGRPTQGLLDRYYWKDLFFEINQLKN